MFEAVINSSGLDDDQIDLQMERSGMVEECGEMYAECDEEEEDVDMGGLFGGDDDDYGGGDSSEE